MKNLHARKRFVALVAATACLTVAVGGPALAARQPQPQPANAGSHVSGHRLVAEPVHLRTLSKAETVNALQDAGFDADHVDYGVKLYRLVYRTTGVHGEPTIASGLIVLPDRNMDRDRRRFRLLSFTHGTEVYKGDAPSSGTNDFANSPPVAFAAAGFAAVSPDYLGLGEGPGTHPWLHLPTETTASLDMLRAAREFMAGRRLSAERSVVVTGFSQGASAALGLARALDERADPWFRLGAVAPISGAYAFRAAEIPALLKGEEVPPKVAVVYTTYLLVAWNRLHHLYDSPHEVFQKEYADQVGKLFDGTTTGEDMFNGLPGSLGELLKPRGFELLEHPTPEFADALRVADSTCTGWAPNVPVRLYYAENDEQAVNANTGVCQAEFAAGGKDLTPIKLPAHEYQGSIHLGSEVTGTRAILDWLGQDTA
ncbi:alpha/beta hydrolase [Flindersiella endophytica]